VGSALGHRSGVCLSPFRLRCMQLCSRTLAPPFQAAVWKPMQMPLLFAGGHTFAIARNQQRNILMPLGRAWWFYFRGISVACCCLHLGGQPLQH
jgi:hypothetical protein